MRLVVQLFSYFFLPRPKANYSDFRSLSPLAIILLKYEYWWFKLKNLKRKFSSFFCNKICFCHFRWTKRMRFKVGQMIADWTSNLLEILMQDSWMWNMWYWWSLCWWSPSLQLYCFNLQTAYSSRVILIIFLRRSCSSLLEENTDLYTLLKQHSCWISPLPPAPAPVPVFNFRTSFPQNQDMHQSQQALILQEY